MMKNTGVDKKGGKYEMKMLDIINFLFFAAPFRFHNRKWKTEESLKQTEFRCVTWGYFYWFGSRTSPFGLDVA